MKKILSILLCAVLLLSLVACGASGAKKGAITVTDMTGREIALDAPATRVVALTASDVEILYALGAGVVFVGMKLVGICEKYAVAAMAAVVLILMVAVLRSETAPLPTARAGLNNALALFGMISFSLSAVMSTPQVVKGLNGEDLGGAVTDTGVSVLTAENVG